MVAQELSVFFFFGREKKSGRERLFLPVFRFFHGQNLLFTPIFFGFFNFFHARIFFSRALFVFFSRAKKRFHGQKFENFHGHLFFFTGTFYAHLALLLDAPIQIVK